MSLPFVIIVFLSVFGGAFTKAVAGGGLGSPIAEWADPKDKTRESFKINKYNRTFIMIADTDKKSGIKTESYFLDGECVQIRLISNSDKFGWESLGDEALKNMWGATFNEEKVEEIQKDEKFVAFWGENGGLMSFGRGQNKGVLNLENAKMRFVSDKYLRSLLKTESANSSSKTDSGLKMTGVKVGGRMKPVFSVDGGLKGYMSDKGLFFNQNMEYEGWVNNR